MSELKQAFQRICLHLGDYQDDPHLKRALPIKDLRKVVQEYVLNELQFENEFYGFCYHFFRAPAPYISHCYAMSRRIMHLLENTNYAGVRNWYRNCFFLLQEDTDGSSPVYIFVRNFFSLSYTVCNRIWCWNRFNGKVTDCICDHPLSVDEIKQTAERLFL